MAPRPGSRIAQAAKRAAEAKAGAAVLKAAPVQVGLIEYVQRTSSSKYHAGWFHRELAEALERFSAAVARGESPRMIISVPPRHGKSHIATERFPVWHLAHYPDHEVIVAAYSQALANKFSRRARAVARATETRSAFPEFELDPERKAVEEWNIVGGGCYKAAGVEGGITGTGAHVLIIDDPVKDQAQADSKVYREHVKEWWSSTASTRIAPGGGVLVIMTRWHEDDLAGHLLELQRVAEANGDEDADRWEVINFPAIAEHDEEHRSAGEALHPERWPLRLLLKQKARMVPRHWLALYQQRPSSKEGQLFKRAWWQRFKLHPLEMAGMCEEVITSWDCAFKGTASADFVVGLVIGRCEGEFYLLDLVRDRMDLPGTLLAMEALASKWKKATAHLVEDKANGPAAVSMLRRKIPGMLEVNPEGGKEARANAASPYVESKNVYLPSPEHAPWVHDFLEEATTFPTGANDDQVDAFTQGVIWYMRRESGPRVRSA